MKTIFYVLSVLVIAGLTACTTTKKRASAKVSAAQKSFNIKCHSIDVQTEAQKKEIVAIPGVLSVTDAEIQSLGLGNDHPLPI